MTKIVIDKMSQFPGNISIDKPIPGKTCFEDPIFFKKSYAKSNGCNGEKARKEAVKYKNEERYFVFFYFESFVYKSSDDFNEQEQGHDG